MAARIAPDLKQQQINYRMIGGRLHEHDTQRVKKEKYDTVMEFEPLIESSDSSDSSRSPGNNSETHKQPQPGGGHPIEIQSWRGSPHPSSLQMTPIKTSSTVPISYDISVGPSFTGVSQTMNVYDSMTSMHQFSSTGSVQCDSPADHGNGLQFHSHEGVFGHQTQTFDFRQLLIRDLGDGARHSNQQSPIVSSEQDPFLCNLGYSPSTYGRMGQYNHIAESHNDSSNSPSDVLPYRITTRTAETGFLEFLVVETSSGQMLGAVDISCVLGALESSLPIHESHREQQLPLRVNSYVSEIASELSPGSTMSTPISALHDEGSFSTSMFLTG